MIKGKVKWFDGTKGFGFISPEKGDKDVFVHANGLKGCSSLTEGQTVEYDIESERGKTYAINVTIIQ